MRFSDSRNTAVYCRLLDGGGNRRDDSFVERLGNDMRFVGIFDEICKCIGRRDFHTVVDVACSGIECAAENPGECKHVVDLILKVASAGCDDARACFECEIGKDFGIGVCHSKDDCVIAHRTNHILRKHVLCAYADEGVGIFYCVFESAFHAARICAKSKRTLRLIEVFVVLQDAESVAHNDVFCARI